ncbi:MAG: hypothetical protein RLN62_05745 [Rickettsiales bacterium]
MLGRASRVPPSFLELAIPFAATASWTITAFRGFHTAGFAAGPDGLGIPPHNPEAGGAAQGGGGDQTVDEPSTNPELQELIRDLTESTLHRYYADAWPDDYSPETREAYLRETLASLTETDKMTNQLTSLIEAGFSLSRIIELACNDDYSEDSEPEGKITGEMPEAERGE